MVETVDVLSRQQRDAFCFHHQRVENVLRVLFRLNLSVCGYTS